MANKRTLNFDLDENHKPSRKKQRIFDEHHNETISKNFPSPVPQADGFSDEVEDRNARFDPNPSLPLTNISRFTANYAPLQQMGPHVQNAPENYFSSKFPNLPVGERNISSGRPLDAFMPHFNMPQRMFKMPHNNFEPPRNFNQVPFQFFPHEISRFREEEPNRMENSDFQLAQFNNGLRPNMPYPEYIKSTFTNQNPYMREVSFASSVGSEFSARDLQNSYAGPPLSFPVMNGLPAGFSQKFPYSNVEKNANIINNLPQKEKSFCHDSFPSNEANSFSNSLNNGVKLLPGHFPYPLKVFNIPPSSMRDAPQEPSSMQFAHQREQLSPFVSHPHLFQPQALNSFPRRFQWNSAIFGARDGVGPFPARPFLPSNMDTLKDESVPDLKSRQMETSDVQNSSKSFKDYPMKMIENFSATHFSSSKSFPLGATGDDLFPKDLQSGGDLHKYNNQSISHETPHSNTLPSSHHKDNRSSDVYANKSGDKQQTQEINPKEPNSKQHGPLNEKKSRKNKKADEQSKYESWLSERKYMLLDRISQLEKMLEQEKLAKLSLPASSSHTNYSLQNLPHMEKALLQLKKDLSEHEILVKVFTESKNSTSKNVKQEKPNRPTKRNSNLPQSSTNGSLISPHFQPAEVSHVSPTLSPAKQSYAPNNSAEPIKSHKSPVKFDSLPMPTILEPSVTPLYIPSLPGMSTADAKTSGMKFSGQSKFKPSDALEEIDSLNDDDIDQMTMSVFSKKAVERYNNRDVEELTADESSKHFGMRVTSDWLVAQQLNFSVESCSQCCRPLHEVYKEERNTIEVSSGNISYLTKFCCADCMDKYNHSGKIYEKYEDMKEEFCDSKLNVTDLNSTLIYDADNEMANKTLPHDISSEDVLTGAIRSSSKKQKWKNERYGSWSVIFHSKKRFKKENPGSEKKSVNALQSVTVPSNVVDERICMLCGDVGDGDGNGAGRLLIADVDKWVHANCSLWSINVYEALDGTLVGSKFLLEPQQQPTTSVCIHCKQPGATIMCFLPNCGVRFHLKCALLSDVCFLENKVTYCKGHCPKNMMSSIIGDISIKRRVCIERRESHQVAKMLREEEPENFCLRSGNLVVHNIGHLLPQHVQTLKFNTNSDIYPAGFKSTRFYWSCKDLHRRCQYVCSIVESCGAPLFKIQIKDGDGDDDNDDAGLVYESSSCTGVWREVLKRLDQLRRNSGSARVFTEYMSGEDMFGLNEPSIRKIIESLPGVELMQNLNLRYGKSSMYIPPLAVNPSGSIRTEPKSRTFFKRSHTLLRNFNAGSSAKSAWLGSGEFNIAQYMKQFTGSKPQRYRSLKTEWRNNVYLRRSNIQGLGLFAAREIEQFTMVIEYIGELIRNEIAELREKVYEQQNRGVYMFRLDENTVVDATMAGGPARYVNHSCDPNCFTEVVPTEKGNKIIIFAKRKIQSGEELSYDYKLNLEDEKSRIPCLCGAANCLKWMN